MDKKKNDSARTIEDQRIQEAFKSPKGSSDQTYASALLVEAKKATKLLHERRINAVGTATALILFAMLRSLQLLPEYTQEFISQQQGILNYADILAVFAGLHELIKFSQSSGDLRERMRQIRLLCALLGMPNANHKKVLQIMELKDAEILAKINAGVIEINFGSDQGEKIENGTAIPPHLVLSEDDELEAGDVNVSLPNSLLKNK